MRKKNLRRIYNAGNSGNPQKPILGYTTGLRRQSSNVCTETVRNGLENHQNESDRQKRLIFSEQQFLEYV